MGGGGGGGARSVGDLSRLEQEAKEALSQKRRSIFISFAYEDIDEVNLLRAQSKNELSSIVFNDWSVSDPFDSTNADYTRQQITERIRQSSMTVVYLSSDTADSRWVEWEVEKSIELGKRVIAVHAGAAPPMNLPDWIEHHGVTVVSWSDLAKTL